MRNDGFAALFFAGLLVLPTAAFPADTIKIGWPMPLSGPTASYGLPATTGAELAVSDINEKGGVLGRKLELLPRDTKASADEAVRQSRELILKNGVDFLSGTLTSAEAPAVSTIAKENKVLFIASIAKLSSLTDPKNLHPYIFRFGTNTTIEGRTAAALMAKWTDVKRVATILPDYGYGHDVVNIFIDYLKKVRPDIEIVDQQWPRLGEPDFTAFISAQMAKKPDAVFTGVFGGDFATFSKQAEPLGYFKAIKNRMIAVAEVGSIDSARALGADFPFGIISNAHDPVVWDEGEPPQHKAYVEKLKKAMKNEYGSGWAIMGYNSILGLAEGIKKAGSTDSDKVSNALLGMSFETPVGTRTINAKTHETEQGEFWGELVKDPALPFAVMKPATYMDPKPYLQ